VNIFLFTEKGMGTIRSMKTDISKTSKTKTLTGGISQPTVDKRVEACELTRV